MIRNLWRANQAALKKGRAISSRDGGLTSGRNWSKFMSTQSNSSTKPPTALATLHLEDGSSLTGRSFGCHESVEGEVSCSRYIIVLGFIIINLSVLIVRFCKLTNPGCL